MAAPNEVLSYLADRPATSIREIMGTVQRVRAGTENLDTPLNLAAVKKILEPSGQTPTMVPIVPAADSYFLDDEKIIWEWPDVIGRLVEELR